MDPIMIAALIALIIAGAFIITKVVFLTAKWLKSKIKEKLENKPSVVGISGDQLKGVLGEALDDVSTYSVDDLDMMLASVDEYGEVDDIEFISSDEGMDEALSNFMRNNGDMILMTNNA